MDGRLGLSCTQRGDCATGAKVVRSTWDGAHTWPAAGETNLATELIWEFFSRQALWDAEPPSSR